MECAAARLLVMRLTDGEIRELDWRRLRAHLSVCERCRSERGACLDLDARLRDAAAGLDWPEEEMEGFLVRLRARLGGGGGAGVLLSLGVVALFALRVWPVVAARA